MQEQPILVLSNLPESSVAMDVAKALVEQRLAACVNIMPGVQSIYRWQGQIEQDREVTLIIKSVRSRYAELETAIKSAHPANVPEIIAVPIIAGLPDYLHWLTEETKEKKDIRNE